VKTLRVKRELESGLVSVVYPIGWPAFDDNTIGKFRRSGYASLKGDHGRKKVKRFREITPTVESFASAATIEKVYLPLKSKQTPNAR